MLDKTYNIAMITDENYVMPTIVALTSLDINSFGCIFDVYVLTNNLSEKTSELFYKQKFSNLNIKTIDASNITNKFKNIKQNTHVTYSALLKFYLPQVLTEADKVLYLDSDILVQKDIHELFDIDINEYYALVTRDYQAILNYHVNKIGLTDGSYFNSGIMLLNLKKMREDNATDKLISYKLNTMYHFMDQDAFNVIFGNKVKYISYRYNILSCFVEDLDMYELSDIYQEDLTGYKTKKSLYQSCAIIHLGGEKKPWIYNLGYLSKLYKKYYNKTVFFDKKLNLKHIQQRNSLLENIFSVKNDNKKRHKVITVFGIKIKIKQN